MPRQKYGLGYRIGIVNRKSRTSSGGWTVHMGAVDHEYAGKGGPKSNARVKTLCGIKGTIRYGETFGVPSVEQIINIECKRCQRIAQQKWTPLLTNAKMEQLFGVTDG